MKCLYCQQECAQIYSDFHETDYRCYNKCAMATFTVSKKDNSILLIHLAIVGFRIDIYPNEFVIWSRVFVKLLHLNYCPDGITPSNVSDKVKLYLTFQ